MQHARALLNKHFLSKAHRPERYRRAIKRARVFCSLAHTVRSSLRHANTRARLCVRVSSLGREKRRRTGVRPALRKSAFSPRRERSVVGHFAHFFLLFPPLLSSFLSFYPAFGLLARSARAISLRARARESERSSQLIISSDRARYANYANCNKPDNARLIPPRRPAANFPQIDNPHLCMYSRELSSSGFTRAIFRAIRVFVLFVSLAGIRN